MNDASEPAAAGRDRLRNALSRYRVPIGILLLVVLLRPVIAHDALLGSSYIASAMLIWMLFAAAFNLLYGYSGLLSFGHAIFLGTGIYGVAIGIRHFDLPYFVAAPIGVIVAGLIAYGIARLIVGYGEIYFAMLTLAFAEAIHFVVNADPFGLTGGADGLRSDTTPAWIESFRGRSVVQLGGGEFELYYFVALVFVIAMLALWQIVRSPFGRTLVAIRDNEELARAMGISTARYQTWAFTLSGVFSAVAGTLLVIRNSGASLENFGMMTGAEVILMSIFGGISYFFGPIAGAFSWFFAREYLTNLEMVAIPLVGTVDVGPILGYWRFFFGFLFVVVIVLSPQRGLWGFVRSIADRIRDRLAEVISE
ncbi:branched-chain amino acid ABC transporter permease [haloarchaeon 3A1-DGR]|nr:branched-chain amino acid ABC transporter permease [haloarchaeon 3A1-DGR]